MIMENDKEEFSESPKQKFEREMREFEGQNIQDYSVRLYFWFSTKLEKDKSLLTIASAAIGLLLTGLIAKGVQNYCQLIFYAFAFISFLVTIITVINIFERNAEQIEQNIANKSHINKTLEKYDWTIAISFYAGIF